MKTLPSLIAALFVTLYQFASASEGPYFGTGVKVGEVDQNSAIIWARLTQDETAKFDLLPIFTEGLLDVRAKDVGRMPTDVAPGAQGEIRVKYWISEKS
ncbi:MAG: hypothetical protein AAGB46_03570, partial [Verrucomicrobiota bacterium]